MCIKINKVSKQEVGIWRVQKRYPQYGIPIWSLWPNIRFLPSIVAEKNEHICSMCIKINKVGKQEAGISWVQKRFPRYGVCIWSLWPNIRFLPSIVAEKNATKNGHIQNVCSMCIKICWEKCDEKCAYMYMFNVYKNQLSRQRGSRNLTGPKTLPTIWHTYMKLVAEYQIPVINSCLEKCDKKCAYTNVC
jgi:hypothetical protein